MLIDLKELGPRERYFLMVGGIVPRPIALVSSVASDGTPNLAPFSFFGGVSATPPVLSVSVGNRGGEKKDTWRNVEETGEFVVNIVDEEMTDKMIATSGDFPPDVNEFEISGLTPLPSTHVRPARVAESPIAFECVLREIVVIENEGMPAAGHILGNIRCVHVRDGLYEDDRIDPAKLRAIGRMGGLDYCHTEDLFSRKRPKK